MKSTWWMWPAGIVGATLLCAFAGVVHRAVGGDTGADTPAPDRGPVQQGNASPPRPVATPRPAPTPKPVEEAVAVTATELLADYKNNEVRGDAKYKGKLVRVTGTIDTIGKDILDDPYVTIGAGGLYEAEHVQCMLQKSQLQAAAALDKGSKATVRGRVKGLTILNVMIDDCVIE